MAAKAISNKIPTVVPTDAELEELGKYGHNQPPDLRKHADIPLDLSLQKRFRLNYDVGYAT